MKKSRKIPKSFTLDAINYTVKEDKNLSDSNSNMGECRSYKNEIVIQAPVKNKISFETAEQTFYHELVHAILFAMGECQGDNSLNDNEKFVDQFASKIHQFYKTVKY